MLAGAVSLEGANFLIKGQRKFLKLSIQMAKLLSRKVLPIYTLASKTPALGSLLPLSKNSMPVFVGFVLSHPFFKRICERLVEVSK